MKRPNSVDSSNSEKAMKYSAQQMILQSTSGATSSQSQGVSYMSNVPPPPQPPMQTQMAAAYYMGGSGYYPAVMATDIASNMYPQYTMATWQMPQQTSQSVYDPGAQAVFDTSRPPPPPLPTAPAPETPPPPPLPPPNKGDNFNSTSSLNNYYSGRTNFGSFAGRGTYQRYGKFKGGFNSSTSPPGYYSSTSPPGFYSGIKINTPALLNGLAPTIDMKPKGFGGKMRGGPKQQNCPIVHKKKRRKPMSERLPTLEWKREDAQRVLDLEKEYHAKRGDKAIVVRFPDPKLNYDIVKKFSPTIESVHFQQPATARSCIVHLKKGTDVQSVIEELNKTTFGMGNLLAEPKRDDFEDEELAVEDIDPYTLYIGNFPSDVDVEEVKEMFHKAKKVDVGYAQKMKVTRYGFARYTNVDDAIEAYKTNYNALYKSRSIIVRFRRNNRSIGLDGDRKGRKKEKKKELEEQKTANDEAKPENGVNNSENESDDGDEAEDTKSGVFDFANNMSYTWNSDDMYDSEDNDEEDLPNLTGFIKHEPLDEIAAELLRPEEDDVPPPIVLDKIEPDSEITDARTTPILIENSSKPDNQTGAYWIDGNNYWEDVRQKELSEKEEKPDLENLCGTAPLEQATLKQAPLEQAPPVPITQYGLVPLILPKEEEECKKSYSEDEDDDNGAENGNGSRNGNRNKGGDFDENDCSSAGEPIEENLTGGFQKGWIEIRSLNR